MKAKKIYYFSERKESNHSAEQFEHILKTSGPWSKHLRALKKMDVNIDWLVIDTRMTRAQKQLLLSENNELRRKIKDLEFLLNHTERAASASLQIVNHFIEPDPAYSARLRQRILQS